MRGFTLRTKFCHRAAMMAFVMGIVGLLRTLMLEVTLGISVHPTERVTHYNSGNDHIFFKGLLSNFHANYQA